MNGKIQVFSIDSLISMLNRADLEVDVDVRPKKDVSCYPVSPLLY